jgi:hypothetical protein
MPEFNEVKDSGIRQSFDSGAVRDIQSGKGRYDLLPTRAIRRLAKHYENGARKYGDNNYLLGMPMKRFADSAIRHLFKAVEGHKDEDHWVAAIWNLMAIVEYQERIEEGLMDKKWDDLEKLTTSSKKE